MDLHHEWQLNLLIPVLINAIDIGLEPILPLVDLQSYILPFRSVFPIKLTNHFEPLVGLEPTLVASHLLKVDVSKTYTT